LAVAALLLPAFSACTVKRGLVDVRGKVVLDGQPIQDAQIYFHSGPSVMRGNGGFATSGRDGSFRARQGTGVWGMHPGEYVVTLSAKILPAAFFTSTSPELRDGMYKSAPERFPHAYTEKQLSPLTATIAEGMKPLSLIIETRKP